MRAGIFGGAVLALLASDCFAQPSMNVPSGTGADAIVHKSQESGTPAKPQSGLKQTSQQQANQQPAPQQSIFRSNPATSKISFLSRPSGARITLSNGMSCVAPCSIIVAFNERFTAIATKRGFVSKEIIVAPSYTSHGAGQIVSTAITHGVIGLAVGLVLAERAYGPTPFVVELVPGEGGPQPSPPTASASGPRVASQTASAARAASNASARVACTPQGCQEVKPGCRVVEQSNISSSSAGGGGGSVVVCR